MSEKLDPPHPDDPQEEWHRKFRAQHEAGWQKVEALIEAERRRRAELAARPRGLFSWFPFRLR